MNPLHFLFTSLFSRENCISYLILFFIHYSVIQLRCFWWNYFLNNFSLLVGLLRLVSLSMVGIFVDGRYTNSHDQWSYSKSSRSCCLSIETCSLTIVFILLHMEQQSISYFEHLLFFFFRIFYDKLDFPLFWPLNFLPSTS